jgi:type I restriction enzyme, S subunit
MSFPRYPTYKPSGVEWLGEVPEHWNVDRMKWAIEQPKNGIWGNEESGDENDIPCVRVADFDRQGLRVFLDNPTIRNVTRKEREGRVLVKNDLLIEKSGGGELQPVGCVVIYEDDRPAISSNFVAKASARIGMSASYWRYLHSAAYSARINTRSIKQTSGIQNLDQSQYLDESSCYPPLREQERIATFLDHETAKIDALIAEQQRLIELLQEKRQAVISHAVTKGLNPDATMKDSGVEWLGEVPEHWEVMPLKRIVAMQSGNSITAETIESAGAYPVYGGNGLRGYTSSFTHSGEFVLIGRQGALCGNINYATGRFFASEHAVVATARKSVDVTWLGEMMRTMNLNQYSVSAAQPGLSVELIGNVRTIYAPLEEQIRLAGFLCDQSETLAGLSTEAFKAIDLLQERRSALISAAVTGQIDVRGLVPEVEAA